MNGVSIIMRPTTRVIMPLNVGRYRAGHSRGRGHGQELPGGGHARLGEATGQTQAGETMRKRQYLVRINKDPVSDWGASVPDLPGCVATGKTIDVALRRIQEAIEIHLQGMREDGLKPPRPRPRAVTPRRTPRQVDFFAMVEVAA